MHKFQRCRSEAYEWLTGKNTAEIAHHPPSNDREPSDIAEQAGFEKAVIDELKPPREKTVAA
jgi:hypothetical protein